MSDEPKYNPNNLIVNYIPQSLGDEEFAALFLSIGPVKASKVIRDKNTGISYGFGFVEFENEADSIRAIEVLNGLQLQNKRIKVAYARQGENMKGANVYVRYLPKNMLSKDLEHLFTGFGEIISARVLTDTNTGLSRGVGFVLFSSRDEATTAIAKMDGKAPPGYTQALAVKFAEDNKLQKMQQHAMLMGLGPPAPMAPYSPASFGGAPQLPLRMPGSPAIPGIPRPHNPTGNTFGAGYQGMFGGGPLRTNTVNQRYNPMSGYSVPGAAGMGTIPGGVPYANGTEEYPLFVYNIGTDMDDRGLWQLFSPYGAIKKINIVRDNEKKQGKGYGFVTMFDYQEAMCAIQQLNGKVIADKPLQVSLKKPKT